MYPSEKGVEYDNSTQTRQTGGYEEYWPENHQLSISDRFDEDTGTAGGTTEVTGGGIVEEEEGSGGAIVWGIVCNESGGRGGEVLAEPRLSCRNKAMSRASAGD